MYADYWLLFNKYVIQIASGRHNQGMSVSLHLIGRAAEYASQLTEWNLFIIHAEKETQLFGMLIYNTNPNSKQQIIRIGENLGKFPYLQNFSSIRLFLWAVINKRRKLIVTPTNGYCILIPLPGLSVLIYKMHNEQQYIPLTI